MAYTDIYTAATDATHVLRKQIAVALHKQALIVMAEATETPDHAQRVALALRILRDPITWAAVAVWRVLENGTVSGAPTAAGDGLIQSVVANSWNTLSKVTI